MIGNFIGGPVGGIIDYGANYSITIEVGTFTLTGQAVALAPSLSCEAGSFTFTGKPADLTFFNPAGGGGKKRRLDKPKKSRAKVVPDEDEVPAPPLTEADLPPLVPEILPPLPPPAPPAWFYAMQQDARDIADAMAILALLPDPVAVARRQDEQDMQDVMRLLQAMPDPAEVAARQEAQDLDDIRALLAFAS